MRTTIFILLALTMCSSTNFERVPHDGLIYTVNKTPKYHIKIKVMTIGSSYSTHIVWAEDSQGNLISVTTH